MLPIVLHNGAEPWTAKIELADLIAPSLPPQLRHWQPQMRYLLLEERRYPEADLARLPNVVAALFRRMPGRREKIQRVIACLVEWLARVENASLRRAFVVWRKCMLLPARVPGVEISNVRGLQEFHDMLAERVKTWTQEWKEQGLLEGRQEGEAKLVRRPLTRRFGPLPARAEERLGQTSEAELEEWGDRVLECRSLQEVFGGSV